MRCSNRNTTYVTLLTPQGRGAVATVLVDGPAAAEHVGSFFRAANGRRLADQPIGRITFGRWGDRQGEDLIVCRVAESSIEVHCHGGRAASAAIIDAIVESGCQQRDWTTHLRASTDDPIQAAAHEALARALTRRTAGILLDQYHGALRRQLDAARAACDAGQIDRALETLRDVQRNSDVGRRLTRPWRVVLAGRPNVGKSSLINALVGYKRAIVFDQPGTTRDVVTATTAVEGWPIELADTAGLCAAGDRATDALEAAGMARTSDALTSADLVLVVRDASQPEDAALAPDELKLVERSSHGMVFVANKIDLVRSPESTSDVAASDTIVTSATLGTGIDQLVAAIAARLVPHAPPPGTAVPFTEAQATAIATAIVQLASSEPTGASQTLRQLC